MNRTSPDTPQVTHATDCNTSPSLTLQMGTTVSGNLAATGSISSNGKNIVTALNDIGPVQDILFAWTIDRTKGSLISGWATMTATSFQRDAASSANYENIAITRAPITRITWGRGPTSTGAHKMIGLSTVNTGLLTWQNSDVWMWFSYETDNFATGVRSECPNGPIFHGTDASGNAGTGNVPADDNLFTDSDTGDLYSIVIDGTTASFYAAKYQSGQNPFRTCTIPSGSYYGKVCMQRCLRAYWPRS